MVNLTYGVLADDGTTILTTKGTDLIATLDDGTIVAYSPGDIAWVLCCTALVWIMIPGLGYLYNGLVRRKNALSLLLMTMLCTAVVSIQWFFWGYSLAFSDNAGTFFGNLEHFGMMGVLDQPALPANSKVPRVVYAMYQLTFAALVPAIAIGAACERGRIGPIILFVFCWSTLVYCPLAEWVWNPKGWAYKWGVLDYAGGGPIEICSGMTGLAYSVYIGRRAGFGTNKLRFRPHNVSNCVLGTVFLWFGWLGFNGGSTFAGNIKAGLAMFNTNLAASMGGITWMVLDFRLERKLSVVGFCAGAICGLVAITPAAGFLGAPASLLVGFLASAVSNWLTSLKSFFMFDDPMDIFSCHAVSGAVGLFLTGLFAQASVAANDAITVIPGGWLDQNWIQLPKQLAWIGVTTGWSFVITYLVMFVIDHIPYCHFRATSEAEIVGTDEDQLGEFAYDFVHAHRDIEAANWNIHDFTHAQKLLSGDSEQDVVVQPVGNSSSEEDAVPEIEKRSSSLSTRVANGSTPQKRSASVSRERGRQTDVEKTRVD